MNPELLFAFAVVLLAVGSAVAVTVALVLLAAVRRRVVTASARARLGAKACVPGPAGEVARLRRDLVRSQEEVRHALAVARRAAAPLGDVTSLLSRLEQAGQAVDGELCLLETVREPRRVAAQLPGPRTRALALIGSAHDLADGLLAAAANVVPDVSMLQVECAIEADALRAHEARAVRASPSQHPSARRG